MSVEKREVQNILAEKAFLLNKDIQIDICEGPNAWIFDLRRVLLKGKYAEKIAEAMYAEMRDMYPFQIGTMEVAGVPLATNLMRTFHAHGHTEASAFFVRKSRKKDGLMQFIEGPPIDKSVPIVLVDDILNSGNSLWRLLETIEAEGYTVSKIWTVLRYRDITHYNRFTEKGIDINSLFTLDDMTDVIRDTHDIDIRNLATPAYDPKEIFTCTWKFNSEAPTHAYVAQKSQPLIDAHKVFFGTDNKTFWALNQKDGSIAWQFTIGQHANKKSIFSNPAMYRKHVIFGAYDGTVYALHKETGACIWKFSDADWVGSSPAVADDLHMVFIGLEFGLFTKRGGIAALDAQTGQVRWSDYTHPAYTHSSPLYIKKHKMVIIGSNDGTVRAYNAKNGTILWCFTTHGGEQFSTQQNNGFGIGEIKESFVYDAKRDHIMFGDTEGYFYIIERSTGELVFQYKCTFGIFSTPHIHDHVVYFSSVDKHLYAIDLETHKVLFAINIDNTRLFSNPVVINKKLFIGTNGGKVVQAHIKTGEIVGIFQTVERVVTHPVYNKKTGRYFIATNANELLCLEEEHA